MNRLLIAGMLLCTSHLMAVAQEAKPGAFKNTFSAGLSLTDGNSETLQANATLLTEGEKEGLGSVRAGVEANYGESTVASNKQTTVENVRVFANAKKTVSPRTFAALNGEALYDSIAMIDYRVTLGPGFGVFLVKNGQTSFSIEAGPSYIWEKVAGVKDDYLALRCAERVEHAFSKTAKVWQSFEYLPRLDDFGDYLMTAEVGAEAALNARLNLRIVLQNKYDSTPGAGLEKNDLALIAGISVSF